ncbi:MAG: phenylacetate-CoA oxygenase/reductase subunit PaaK [Bacteriovoracaceae bacterium]|nr:phenylacetate-CoA oxygenase/reductase subunit PaaK [Bacteriovoracaceae bacterium]
MSAQFYDLKVKEVKPETHDCVSVLLDVPKELKEKFQFTHGQYLTFKKVMSGEEVRRSYSICTSPMDNELRVAIKKLEGGVFSTWANRDLKVGEMLSTMTPEGRFSIALNSKNKKNYLLIAAGSGITPILSILKSILLQEPLSQVTLIYGNKNKGSIIFKNEIEGLKNKFVQRLSVYHVLSRERAEAEFLAGRIDAKKMEYFLAKVMPVNEIDDVLLCGPEEMILSSKEILEANGLPASKIHFELFFSQKSQAKKALVKSAETDLSQKSKISLKLDGVETVFNLSYEGENILDAALKNGVDLPFACKGGVCATCRAKVESGTVEMDVNYSLAPDEVAQGFVLTCQSHPRSSEVKVNFDIK